MSTYVGEAWLLNVVSIAKTLPLILQHGFQWESSLASVGWPGLSDCEHLSPSSSLFYMLARPDLCFQLKGLGCAVYSLKGKSKQLQSSARKELTAPAWRFSGRWVKKAFWNRKWETLWANLWKLQAAKQMWTIRDLKNSIIMAGLDRWAFLTGRILWTDGWIPEGSYKIFLALLKTT